MAHSDDNVRFYPAVPHGEVGRAPESRSSPGRLDIRGGYIGGLFRSFPVLARRWRTLEAWLDRRADLVSALGFV